MTASKTTDPAPEVGLLVAKPDALAEPRCMAEIHAALGAAQLTVQADEPFVFNTQLIADLWPQFDGPGFTVTRTLLHDYLVAKTGRALVVTGPDALRQLSSIKRALRMSRQVYAFANLVHTSRCVAELAGDTAALRRADVIPYRWVVKATAATPAAAALRPARWQHIDVDRLQVAALRAAAALRAGDSPPTNGPDACVAVRDDSVNSLDSAAEALLRSGLVADVTRAILTALRIDREGVATLPVATANADRVVAELRASGLGAEFGTAVVEPAESVGRA